MMNRSIHIHTEVAEAKISTISSQSGCRAFWQEIVGKVLKYIIQVKQEKLFLNVQMFCYLIKQTLW